MTDASSTPSDRDLLVFRALLVLFAFFAPWTLYRRGLPLPVTIALGTFFLALAVVSQLAPATRLPIYHGWMRVVSPIGAAVSFVMLGLAFFLVVTPLAWVRRRVAADPLQRQFVREATTYWESRKARTPESYFKEF